MFKGLDEGTGARRGERNEMYLGAEMLTLNLLEFMQDLKGNC